MFEYIASTTYFDYLVMVITARRAHDTIEATVKIFNHELGSYEFVSTSFLRSDGFDHDVVETLVLEQLHAWLTVNNTEEQIRNYAQRTVKRREPSLYP